MAPPLGRPTIPAWMTIGEMAKRTGVASSALRYYEERGLIFSERNGSGHRRYPRPIARRVAFIVFAQRVGLTLDEIRTELDKLPRDRVPHWQDWVLLTTTWTSRIDARIQVMERLRNSLTDCIGCGCLSMERCRVMNPFDMVASRGPGPRFWEGDPRPTVAVPAAAERASGGRD